MVQGEIKYFVCRGTLVWLSEAGVEPLDSSLKPKVVVHAVKCICSFSITSFQEILSPLGPITRG